MYLIIVLIVVKKWRNKMIYFIVNTTSKSGRGKAVWKEVREQIKKYSFEYKAFRTKYKGHATWLAKKISELDDDDINLIVIGGDGTVNEVVNGITDFEKVKFAIIPAGSGNDFARGLKLGKDITQITKDIFENIKLCAEKNPCLYPAIDLGEVSWDGCEKPRKFAISSGIGLDAIVCKKALDSKLKDFLNKIHLGKLTYIILTVQTLFSMDTFNGKCIIDGEEKNYDKIIFSAIMNFRAEGGGVPMAPGASATDGKFSVCCVAGIPQWLTFFCLPVLVMAQQKYIKRFELFDCEEYSFELDKPVVLHTDGEYVADVNKVEYRCLPAQLKMLNTIN